MVRYVSLYLFLRLTAEWETCDENNNSSSLLLTRTDIILNNNLYPRDVKIVHVICEKIIILFLFFSLFYKEQRCQFFYRVYGFNFNAILVISSLIPKTCSI